MDWANEEYVKVYRRETDDDLLLSWQAMALWRAMLLKFDRSGVLETRRGIRGLAALVRIPAEVVEPAIAELLGDGRVQETSAGYFAPNFMEAQETSKGDKLRQRDSRLRRAEKARNATRAGDDVSTATVSHNLSHAVTAGHESSQPVTLSSALLCDPDPLLSEPPARAIPPPVVGPTGAPAQDHEQARARGRLAESFWVRVSDARMAEAARLKLTGVLPLPKISPAHEPAAFRELRARIREEGDAAAAVCEHVLARLVEQARATQGIEWLSEKAFLEGSWRTAREAVPGAPRAGPRERDRNQPYQVPGIRKVPQL